MKRTVLSFLLIFSFLLGNAQRGVEYQTFIYTSDDLASEIALQASENETRGYLGDLLNAGKESIKGIASGYISSFIDLGINAIGSLATRNARLKKEWEETVKTENVYTTSINSVSELSDFYNETSFDGAMDPKGMRFDGIGCLRKEGNDTVFYISCHIDRSKIHRIINHSKFELILDTLIISPTRSNLPNTQLDIPFSFKERKNFALSMNIKLTSSWMNEIVQLQKNQELGEFNINIPIDSASLDKNGFFRYVRQEGTASKYPVVGESFIVPRSYMGYRDRFNNFKNSWGTGEYKLAITLKESCDVTEEYRKNWKKDWKHRKEITPKDGFFVSAWQTISNQKWDELSQTWIITTLKAPAGIISKDIIDKLGLETKAAPNAAMGGASMQAGAPGAAAKAKK